MDIENLGQPTADAVRDLLDMEKCAINMTGLVTLLPGYDPAEIKRLTNDLYMQGQIQRVSVMGPKGRYHAFYSLYVRTSNGYTATAVVDPAPPLTADQAVSVLERGGWTPEPEVVEVERRMPERRRISAMDVIDRWRLGYRLSRVIEIVGGARNRKLTRDDAATVIRMVREHVRGGE